MRLRNLLLVVPVLFMAECGGRSSLDTVPVSDSRIKSFGGSANMGGMAATGGKLPTGGHGTGGICCLLLQSCRAGDQQIGGPDACPPAHTCYSLEGCCGYLTWCAVGTAGSGGSSSPGSSEAIAGTGGTGGTSSLAGTMSTSATCVTGTRNCACYSSGACRSGLVCNTGKMICVEDPVATGGAPATGGTTSTSVDAGSGCTGSLEAAQSSSGLCVAKMATISAPSGFSDYSIDVTEVTKGQYDAWLATNPALPASTDASCSYVLSYAEQGTGYTGIDVDHHPVVYVDWCDSYAYCQSVGKRLCGAIGGGSNNYANYEDATISQWYRACSSGGVDKFPYGNTYQATYCDGPEYGTNQILAQTVAAGSLANCVTSTTGYAGVFDLSGNVWEWEDSCSVAGQSATCHFRGGACDNGSSDFDCGLVGDVNRSLAYNNVGFRCCSL